MASGGLRRFTACLLTAAVALALGGCSSASPLDSEPAVLAAKGYAQALPGVLLSGDLSVLKPFATIDQIERVGRYRLLLEGERGQVLSARLDSWDPQSIATEGESALVRAAESWSTQPLDAMSGDSAGKVEPRRVVTEYQLKYVDGVWLVDNLTERTLEEE